GVDGDELQPFVLVVVVELFNPALVELRRGTVVALEDDPEDLGAAVLRELVHLAVDARQVEIRRRRADRENRMLLVRLDAAARLGRRLSRRLRLRDERETASGNRCDEQNKTSHGCSPAQ